jgi:hypothetical protein
MHASPARPISTRPDRSRLRGPPEAVDTVFRGLCYPICYPRAATGRPVRKYATDIIGEPVGIRTRDLLIKSQLLYRLSYGLAESSRT